MLKNNLALLQQKIFLYPGMFLLAIFFVQWRNTGDSNKVQDTAIVSAINFADTDKQNLDPNLHYLYIETDKIKSLFDKKPKKIILQFLKTNDDQLTVFAWAGKKNSPEDVEFDDKISLEIGKQSNAANMEGKNVIIGNIEISDEDIAKLEKAINSGGYRYICFEPELKQYEKDLVMIIYHLWGSETPDIQPGLKSTNLLISPNPSPPRKAI